MVRYFQKRFYQSNTRIGKINQKVWNNLEDNLENRTVLKNIRFRMFFSNRHERVECKTFPLNFNRLWWCYIIEMCCTTFQRGYASKGVSTCTQNGFICFQWKLAFCSSLPCHPSTIFLWSKEHKYHNISFEVTHSLIQVVQPY